MKERVLIMKKKTCVAMLLAGGQGSRLGVLTKKVAKPAVPYGGKYRIIDFPLSNCVNSGIYTVGVLTQYQPLELNDYIGKGQPWERDSENGGVHIPKEALALIGLKAGESAVLTGDKRRGLVLVAESRAESVQEAFLKNEK